MCNSLTSSTLLNLLHPIEWPDHRSGWGYVLSYLRKFEHPNGLIVDTCIDSTFGYNKAILIENSIIPLKKDWVGFLHHPMNICPWYEQDELSPQKLLETSTFKKSLNRCLGLITLSEDLAFHVRQILPDVNIRSLKHPTDKNVSNFSYERFLESRKIVHIGTWLREYIPFFKLSAEGYKKFLPLNQISIDYINREFSWLGEPTAWEKQSVTILKHLDNESYDHLLAQSLVFIKLYDSSVNNTIIECIVRNTPILVNKIPSVVEYLGEQYPLYYDQLEEAEILLRDDNLILSAHNYLREMNKDELSGERFIKQFFEVINEFKSTQ